MARARGRRTRIPNHGRAISRRLPTSLWVLLIVLAAGHSLAEDKPPQQSPSLTLGAPLANALAAFRPLGINIVSSSQLVSRRHRVTRLPDRQLPLIQQIQALLESHELEIKQLNAGTWYVVRREPQALPAPTQPLVAPLELEPVIEEIVVTASYRLARVASSTQTLDAADLATLPSIGNDALRAVAHLPGVASSGVSAASRLRGGDSNELLYLLDNVELIEPFHLSEFHSLFSSVNSNIVESIEVFPGGYPANYGGKMSGLVAVDLIEPQQLEGAIDINTVVAAAHVGGGVGNWNWLASARRSTIDLALEQLENDYGEPEFHDQLLRGSWHGTHQTWQFGLLNSTDAVSLSDPGLEESGSSSLDYRSAWLKADFTLTDQLYSAVQLQFVQRDGTSSGELDNAELAEGTLTKEISFLSVKLSNNWAWHGPADHTVKFGWFAERQNADFETELEANFGPLGQVLRETAVASRELEVDRWGYVLGGYVAGEARRGNVDIDWGVRFAHQRIDPAKSSGLEPRLQLVWRPAGRTHQQSATAWSLAMDIGRYVQHQDLYQVQIDDGLVELQDPQRNDQVGFTLERIGNGLRTQASAYYRKIHDPWSRFDNIYNPWVLLPELQPDRIELRASRASAWGAELLAANLEGAPIRWSVSYAWAKAEERIDGRWVPRPWDQRHTLKARTWYESDSWQVGLSLIGRSGWPTTPLVSNQSNLSSQLYEATLSDFWSLDLHVARTFRIGKLEGSAYLDVSNTTSRENLGGYTYSLETTDAQTAPDLTSARRRSSKLLPVFPTIGLRIRW